MGVVAVQALCSTCTSIGACSGSRAGPAKLRGVTWNDAGGWLIVLRAFRAGAAKLAPQPLDLEQLLLPGAKSGSDAPDSVVQIGDGRLLP
jgi:hypothetical protein